MRRLITTLVASAALAACNRGPQQTAGGPDTGLAAARSSHAKDSLILLKDSLLADRQRQLSLQSQLIGDAATSARLVSEISRDLSRVRGLKVKADTAAAESAVQGAAAELAVVQRKVTAVIARLNASESRLRKMRSDSTTHASLDSAQVAQMRDYERSIGDLRASVEQQRREIAVLQQRVDSVTQVNVALAARNDSVTARNVAMAAHEDSVFVAVGTEKELVERGIIRKEGGTAFFFGRGKTIVPARSLDMSSFQVISKSKDLEIPLPRADKEYKLVSRQSLAYTDTQGEKDAMVRGSLKITDPSKFWAASRYLILVQR